MGGTLNMVAVMELDFVHPKESILVNVYVPPALTYCAFDVLPLLQE
jgi:hypothetical protein